MVGTNSNEAPEAPEVLESSEGHEASESREVHGVADGPEEEPRLEVAARRMQSRMSRGYSQDTDAYLRRLKRIEGQVRGISRMVEEGEYCIDVLTQISAVKSALHSVSMGLLEDHMGHCVVGAARESDEAAAEKVREASTAIARLVKS